MGKIKVLTLAAFFILTSALAGLSENIRIKELKGIFNSLQGPRLVAPVSEKVSLTGKDHLEFRWINDSIDSSGFIFRIYQGYNMYESTLLYKDNLPSSASSVKINAGLFEDAQTYTWSLVRISFNGVKSDKSFNSFKVLKR